MNFTHKYCAYENLDDLYISGITALDLGITLDCGQSFRWHQVSKTENSAVFAAVVGCRAASVTQTFREDGTSVLCFADQSMDDLDFWVHYFDLDRDYDAICKTLKADATLRSAINEFPGIRILNQDPFETLISFIISQNNNIPRIKGIISRLCENFGEPAGCGYWSFPSAERLAALSVEDLSPLRAGFRSKYILDAARKAASGEINLEALKNCSLEEADKALETIKGVGPKVAQCVCLYGLEHTDAFPVDVWVRRIMAELYPDGLPVCAIGLEGIAQQFLFHWRRNSKSFR